jgi:hypothetical protein
MEMTETKKIAALFPRAKKAREETSQRRTSFFFIFFIE